MEIYYQQRKSVYINGNKSKILKGKEGVIIENWGQVWKINGNCY